MLEQLVLTTTWLCVCELHGHLLKYISFCSINEQIYSYFWWNLILGFAYMVGTKEASTKNINVKLPW